MKLEVEQVESIFTKCLFREGEDTTNYVEAEGIVTNVGFHPGRLEEHKKDILALLHELPDSFKEGMSFLNACEDRHGNQWTSLHRNMEQLFQLGIAIGEVKACMPREFWSSFPGGMPYYQIAKGKDHG